MSVGTEHMNFDEVVVTTEPMRRYFRFLGLCPYLSAIDGRYHYHWAKWQPFMVIQTILLSIYAIYSSFVDMIFYLKNDLEKYVLSIIVLELLIGVLINVGCLLYNCNQWSIFFQRWNVIDQLLNVQHDRHIRRYSRLIFIGFTFYVILLILFAIATAILLVVHPDAMAIGPTYVIAIFTYASYWSICLLLPELLCLFLLLVTCARLQTICRQLAVLFDGRLLDDQIYSAIFDRLEVTEEVERLRIAYQLLMDSVGHVKQFLGPVLVTTCILHGIPLPLFIYSFIKQGQTDLTIKMLKIVAFVTNFIRVAIMCFVGENVSDQSKKVVGVLRDAPSHKLSLSTNDEIIFFMNCSRVSSTKVSAWGFLDVDTGYLQSVVGVIIAYTITIMQFETSTCHVTSPHSHNVSMATAELNITMLNN